MKVFDFLRDEGTTSLTVILTIREFKQIPTAGATTAAVTEKV